jgi:hypothetical protein
MEEPPLTRRRCFRYSLRTMFVVVAIAAIWLAWEARWIKQRHEFLSSQKPLVEQVVASSSSLINTRLTREPTEYSRRVVRWLFREEPMDVMMYVFFVEGPADPALAGELAKQKEIVDDLFPEANGMWLIGLQK